MKKITILALSIASFFAASSAHAVEGGTPISWVDHPYLVESRCTGTVLAGKYVMLAGHCALGELRPVNLSNGTSIMPTGRNTLYKPELPETEYADIALWTLPKSAPMDKIVFIDDLNNAANAPQLNDEVTIMGFGQNDSVPRLGMITNYITSILYPEIYIYGHATQYITNGDSGAPVFNSANRIISTMYSSTGSNDPATGLYEQNGVNLRLVKNWLLKGINDWHSPTELKFTGAQTIEIQSLHVNDKNLADRWNNKTLTAGEITVMGGTCVTDMIVPFGTCTLDVDAGVGEGKIKLTDNNIVTINRAAIVEPDMGGSTDKDNNNSGGGGGSLGWLTLLALLPLAWRRK
jgi:V8-like Glu-specific endopeptidase